MDYAAVWQHVISSPWRCVCPVCIVQIEVCCATIIKSFIFSLKLREPICFYGSKYEN